MRKILFAGLAILGLCACQTPMRPKDFAAGRPALDPVAYFSGRTASAGVIENRRGRPTHTVTTTTEGTRDGDTLRIEQDLVITPPGRAPIKSHRSWSIRRLDDHHFQGTANDVIGITKGEAYGNVFHWDLRLAVKPGNPIYNIRMSQWMYLQPDGVTLVNHSTLRKAGFVVAQVTEQFAKAE